MGDFDAWVSLINAADGTSAVSGIFLSVLFNYFHTLLLPLFFSSCDP
jgi:hypothetical protein